jgi:hypothetical protein
VITGNLFITLFAVVLYSALGAFVPEKALKSAGSIIYMLINFAIFGSSAILGPFIRSIATGPGIKPDSVSFLPNAWAAFALAQSSFPQRFILPVLPWAISLLLAWIAFKGASVQAARVLERSYSNCSPKRRKAAPLTLTGGSPENQAAEILMRSHLRYDTQFRMGILSVISLTLIYFLIVVIGNRAPIIDPFTQAGRTVYPDTFFIYLAISFLPISLKDILSSSSQGEASWIFFSTPVDRVKFLLAGRSMILWYFSLPYLVAMGVVFAVLSGEIIHTVMHFTTIFLLVLILLDGNILFFPELPFSRVPQKGRQGRMVLIRLGVATIFPAVLSIFVLFLYQALYSYVAGLAGLLLIWAAIQYMGRKHAAKKLAMAEYR